MFAQKGSVRIDKVIGKVKANIDELALGSSEVQTEIESNEAKVEAKKEELKVLEEYITAKNDALSKVKEIADKVKKNLENLLG